MQIRKVMIIYPAIILPERDRPVASFPLGAGYVAAALERAGFEVSCLDAIAEGKGISRYIGGGMAEFGLGVEEIMERVRSFSPDAVGFSCQFSVQYHPTRALIASVRQWKQDVVTVIGGSHSSAQPGETMIETGVHYVVIGEGERTIAQLFWRISTGNSPANIGGLAWRDGTRIGINPHASFVDNLDTVSPPARHLFNMEAYFDTTREWGGANKGRQLSMITSRGCPFRCTFCAVHTNMGRKFRARSASSVLAELDDLVSGYWITHIMFEDDNISFDRKRFMEILQGLIDRNYNLSWSTPSGMALWTLDEEVLELMKKSGCSSISLGIESGSERVLCDIIHKQLASKDEIRRRVSMIKRYGLPIIGFWVIGLPGETRKEMWDTLDFARELALDYNQVLIALPYRGTELYEICQQNEYFAYPEIDPNQMLETQALISTPDFSPEDVLAIQQAGRFLAIRDRGVGLIQALRELFTRHGSFGFRVLAEVARKRLGFYDR